MSIRIEDCCCEPLELVENCQQAEADGFKGWCMHHRLEIQPDGTRVSMKELIDKGLYFGRPAEELVFMRREEHMSLHSTGNKFFLGKHFSAETRRKLSELRRGENHPLFGKHRIAETCQKLSEARKGMHWWNNGIEMKMSRECPGPQWKRGMI